MAITLTETPDSRGLTSGARPTVTFYYKLAGTSNEQTAKAALEAGTSERYYYPGDLFGLMREECVLEPEWVDETTGDGVWRCEVRYVRQERSLTQPETGESSYRFDTGGGTQHVMASLQTVGAYGTGASLGDHGNLINATPEAVQGVDIQMPIFEFAETHYIDDRRVTAAYVGGLFWLTARVNNSPFRELQAGECLFLGAGGSKRGDDDWEITFRFAGSPNVTGLSVGAITGIAKKGWEYMWVDYRPAKIGAAPNQRLRQYPVAVYIEQVYWYGNFAQLGI